MITQYEDFLRHVYEKGVAKTDRTGTGTRSVFGYQMRFDLTKGFPAVTTKRVAFKAVVAELLWFLSGSTNNNDLRALGATIWDEWAKENGDLGPIYGEQLRRWYAPTSEIKLVDVRTDTYSGFAYPFKTERRQPIECDLNSKECYAVSSKVENGNTCYEVQLESGFVASISRPNWRACIAAGSEFRRIDGYAKNIAGVGFLGEPIAHEPRLYTLWANMIERCYNPERPSFKSYGGSGCSVSPIWHSFEWFVKTIQLVPGYQKWNAGEDMCLDKDYFGSKIYGPSTCIFLSRQHNLELNGDPVEISGVKWTSVTEWARSEGVAADYAVSRWKSGKSYKGIAPDTVKFLEAPPGKVWRRTIIHDQITEAMRLLRDDPDSRRILVSAWNVADLDQMALMPCHALFQFYTRELSRQERINLHVKQVASGEFVKTGTTEGMDEHLDAQGVPRRALSCQLYQRSADLFLGVPFNIASYALLTHMMAQQCNMVVGDFIWTGGDCHIYSNHFAQVEEQLSRQPYSYPTLAVARCPEDIFSYRPEDFQLVGYAHHPAISAPVAV